MIKIIIMGTTPFSVVIAELISREGIYDVIGFYKKRVYKRKYSLGAPYYCTRKT